MRNIAALVAGVVFGLGITISGMINPAKVLNFFDVAGAWDPSLALVMASALLTTAIGYRFILRNERPLFDSTFHLPGSTTIDKPLILGSALYGVGWGLIGFCPGGLVPALGLMRVEPWIFGVALVAGMAIARFARSRLAESNSATQGAA